MPQAIVNHGDDRLVDHNQGDAVERMSALSIDTLDAWAIGGDDRTFVLGMGVAGGYQRQASQQQHSQDRLPHYAKHSNPFSRITLPFCRRGFSAMGRYLAQKIHLVIC
ncbi:MAG: hypothetical protein R2854_06035 [Caldilineaceae bacterium]